MPEHCFAIGSVDLAAFLEMENKFEIVEERIDIAKSPLFVLRGVDILIDQHSLNQRANLCFRIKFYRNSDGVEVFGEIKTGE